MMSGCCVGSGLGRLATQGDQNVTIADSLQIDDVVAARQIGADLFVPADLDLVRMSQM